MIFYKQTLVAGQEKKFISFHKAKELVQSMNFKTIKDYRNWIRSNERPQGLPASPGTIKQYKSNWKGERDFVFGEKRLV